MPSRMASGLRDQIFRELSDASSRDSTNVAAAELLASAMMLGFGTTRDEITGARLLHRSYNIKLSPSLLLRDWISFAQDPEYISTGPRRIFGVILKPAAEFVAQSTITPFTARLRTMGILLGLYGERVTLVRPHALESTGGYRFSFQPRWTPVEEFERIFGYSEFVNPFHKVRRRKSMSDAAKLNGSLEGPVFNAARHTLAGRRYSESMQGSRWASLSDFDSAKLSLAWKYLLKEGSTVLENVMNERRFLMTMEMFEKAIYGDNDVLLRVPLQSVFDRIYKPREHGVEVIGINPSCVHLTLINLGSFRDENQVILSTLWNKQRYLCYSERWISQFHASDGMKGPFYLKSNRYGA